MQAQTLDDLHEFSLAREGNTEGLVPVRGMNAFAAAGLEFDRVFAVHSNPNSVVFDVCCRVHW